MWYFVRGFSGAIALLGAWLSVAVGQTFTPNRSSLPIGPDNETVTVVFNWMPADLFVLAACGKLQVRWGDTFLPVVINAKGYLLGSTSVRVEFVVPSELRRPGLAEFVFFDAESDHPLPYRGWLPILIPVRAEQLEADTENDRIAVLLGDTGYGDGKRISMFRISSGETLGSVVVPPPGLVLALSPDARKAWIVPDPKKGVLIRLDLESGQSDQSVPVDLGGEPYLVEWSAEVPRRQPELLVVTVGSQFGRSTTAYSNGVRLPGAAPGQGAVTPHISDDQGRYAMQNGERCELDPVAGFGNCRPILPGSSEPFKALWRQRGLNRGGRIVDLSTGTLLPEGFARPDSAQYLEAGNRVVLGDSYSGVAVVADADTLEPQTGILMRQGLRLSARRFWGQDWLWATGDGLFVGRVPQMGRPPEIEPAGVTHMATGEAGALAPGEMLRIRGRRLGPDNGVAGYTDHSGQYALDLEHTVVGFDGVAGALLSASADEIRVVAPESVTWRDAVEVQVVRFGLVSQRITLKSASHNPGLFVRWVDDRPYAYARDEQGAAAGIPDAPLKRGSLVQLLATGTGLAAGQRSDQRVVRPARLPEMPEILIGGIPANVRYAGSQAGECPGLTVLEIEVPSDAPSGPLVEVQIRMGEQSRGNTWVAVE